MLIRQYIDRSIDTDIDTIFGWIVAMIYYEGVTQILMHHMGSKEDHEKEETQRERQARMRRYVDETP
jgi:hypothetical protein